MLERIKEKEEWLEKIEKKEKRLADCKKLFENDELFPEKNNKVWISGIVEEDFYYGFKINEKKYYRTRVKVERFSGEIDYIPIVIEKRFKDISWKEKAEGKKIKVAGQLCSRNTKREDGKIHLDLYVFVTSAQLVGEDEEFVPEDFVYINAYICKEPRFRTTPFNKKITDLMLAVNREGCKTDYIPTIAWSAEAYRTADASVGTNIEIYGRLQSRKYNKQGVVKTTYELSIGNIDRMVFNKK